MTEIIQFSLNMKTFIEQKNLNMRIAILLRSRNDFFQQTEEKSIAEFISEKRNKCEYIIYSQLY